MKLVKVTIDT